MTHPSGETARMAKSNRKLDGFETGGLRRPSPGGVDPQGWSGVLVLPVLMAGPRLCHRMLRYYELMPSWALIDLESRMSSKDEISGVEIATRIGGQRCQILFPRLPANMPRPTIRALEDLTTAGPASIRHPDDSGPWEELNPSVWGGFSYGSRGARLHLRHLGVRFDDLDRPDATLLADAEKWRSYLLGWLPVLHGALTEIIEVYDPVIWLEEEPDIVPAAYYDPATPVDLDTWRHAIYHASAVDEVPLALLLVYRAVKAAHEEDYRQAVVDAATGFELTLHGALKRTIDESDQQHLGIADTILKSVTLGRLISLAGSLGVWVPEDCSERVAQTRNSTVHRGVPPSGHQTRALLNATAQLMNHHEMALADHTHLDCKQQLPNYIRNP